MRCLTQIECIHIFYLYIYILYCICVVFVLSCGRNIYVWRMLAAGGSHHISICHSFFIRGLINWLVLIQIDTEKTGKRWILNSRGNYWRWMGWSLPPKCTHDKLGVGINVEAFLGWIINRETFITLLLRKYSSTHNSSSTHKKQFLSIYYTVYLHTTR